MGLWQEEGRPWAGGNLSAGSFEVVRIGGMESSCDAHQEADRWVSETAGQNWRVSWASD